MRKHSGPVATCLAALAFLSTVCARRPLPIVGVSEDPQLIETSWTNVNDLLTEAEYAAKAHALASNPAFVPMTKKPAGLGANARFGVNLSFEEQRRSWAIDGDAAQGYTLYGDVNGNGDLSDDAPRRFAMEDGKPTLRYALDARDRDGSGTYPVVFKLVLDAIAGPATTAKRPALLQYFAARRRGQLAIPSRALPLTFRMTGRNGVYDAANMAISFDLDNDGTFDAEIERYLLSERFLNIGGRSYAFSVDRHGRSVTLTPLTEQRPDRVILKTGFPAPDFQFVDLDGSARRLSDFRGKVVLLDFWGVWCTACVDTVPKLVELYGKYHSRGFEIVGIEARDSRERVAAFIAAQHMPWTQTLESDTGPIATLYRTAGWPTSFLIGPDGKFLAANYLGEVDVQAELTKLFPG